MKKIFNGKIIDVESAEKIEKYERKTANSLTVVDDVWYDFAPSEYMGETIVAKYRKLSNQNILEICINGMNEEDISGDLDFGRLPVEYRPSEWGLLFGMLSVEVNGEYIHEMQFLNIGDDGYVFTGSYRPNSIVNSFMFYGVINL